MTRVYAPTLFPPLGHLTPVSVTSQRKYLDETVDLVSLVPLGKSPMVFDDCLRLANLRAVDEGEVIVRRLVANDYMTRKTDAMSRLELTDRGQPRLAEFNAFWSDFSTISPASAAVITKLEEGLSCRHETGVVAEEAPR